MTHYHASSNSEVGKEVTKLFHTTRNYPKSRYIFFVKWKMIANLLPEATHSSLDSFEKPSLLVIFDGSFCQKLGPIYSPNGPMLESEVAGDRNNFINLQKNFLEVKCKIVQSSEADLKYNVGTSAGVTETDSSYFCNNVLYSLFSDCTVSASGLKISNANGNYAQKSLLESKFSHNKDAKITRLACQVHSYEENPGTLSTAEVNRRKLLVRQSAECTFYGKIAVEFFYLWQTSVKCCDTSNRIKTLHWWFCYNVWWCCETIQSKNCRS